MTPEPRPLTAAVERELHRVMCGGVKHRVRGLCIVMAPNIARGLDEARALPTTPTAEDSTVREYGPYAGMGLSDGLGEPR